MRYMRARDVRTSHHLRHQNRQPARFAAGEILDEYVEMLARESEYCSDRYFHSEDGYRTKLKLLTNALHVNANDAGVLR
jgi:hypothetical protein